MVYLSAQARTALKTWLAARPKVSAAAVFVNRFGKRLTVTGIQDRLAPNRHRAGIGAPCHDLGDTLGRHLAEARVPVTTIQRIFGHARLRAAELCVPISDPEVQASYE